jgi:trimethylamine--corrinoid protein Co-methyltransferase
MHLFDQTLSKGVANMQPHEFLTKNQVEQIHHASMQILETIGIDFHYLPALEVLQKGGARVEGERVFFPEQMVMSQMAKAPAEFTLYARNPEYDVTIGGPHLVFTPGYGAPFVTDLDAGRREGTLQDFENFVKLTQASPHQDICSGIVIEPNDVPHETRHAHMIYAAMKYSEKPFMGSTMGAPRARDSIRMASILFGSEDRLSEKPCMVSLMCPLTPLVYDERMTGAMMAYARAGQPLLISSLVIAGATGPTTLAGSLALQNAEVLAGIVLSQLVREGVPVIFSGISSNVEMRSGVLRTGSPEMAINSAATAQMGRFYGLPVRSGGAVCDAKYPDAQAAYESMMNLMAAQACGVNFVLHSAGILESYNCMSYEKFIIDDETCGMIKRMRKNYAVSKESLALDVIETVGPGGHFLDCDHTFEHFRTEFYQSSIASRDDFDLWQAGGSKQITQTASQKVKEILAEHRVTDLPNGTDKDLKRFMNSIG